VDVPQVKKENFRKRYLVILADRQKGRFFTIYLGTFEDSGEEFVDEDVPQRVKNDNARWGVVERHIRDHLLHHFKHVGASVMRYLINRNIRQLDGVFIGSHKEYIHQIKEYLPSRLKQKVIGEFVSNVDVPAGDLTSEIINKFNL
jgi:peptide subunit release factor 1 (eRF1)